MSLLTYRQLTLPNCNRLICCAQCNSLLTQLQTKEPTPCKTLGIKPCNKSSTPRNPTHLSHTPITLIILPLAHSQTYYLVMSPNHARTCAYHSLSQSAISCDCKVPTHSTHQCNSHKRHKRPSIYNSASHMTTGTTHAR